jgi:type I restriction enzyme M protein
MKADGFSLDDKRNEISDNDIPDIIARFNNLEAEADRTRNDQSFFVPKAELVENDYDLSMNKYKKVDRVVVEFEKPEVILARIKSLQSEIDKAITEYESLI